MSRYIVVGDVTLNKGYVLKKDENHLKRLWIQEHIDEIAKLVQVEVLDGGETKDVLVGGIRV
jgi:hypothetical protein